MEKEEYSLEDVPKFLRNRSTSYLRLNKEEEKPKLDESHKNTTITKEEEKPKLNGFPNTSSISKILNPKNSSDSIDEKVINSNTKTKSSSNTDYDNLNNKKHDDYEPKNYREEIINGLLNNNINDKIRDLHNTPLASEENISDWFRHDMTTKSKSVRLMMFYDLLETLDKESSEKGWGIEKYKMEVSRMHKKLFPEIR